MNSFKHGLGKFFLKSKKDKKKKSNTKMLHFIMKMPKKPQFSISNPTGKTKTGK